MSAGLDANTLAALPIPELKLLAAYVVGEEINGAGLWHQAVESELEMYREE